MNQKPNDSETPATYVFDRKTESEEKDGIELYKIV